jgi:hypothetical protein
MRSRAILKHNYPEGDDDYDVKTFRVGDLFDTQSLKDRKPVSNYLVANQAETVAPG